MDPSWECGFGFGPVKRKRTDLVLPWEDPVFSFVAQETTFLDQLQETLLELPAPVPLPAPADTKAKDCVSQASSLPQPKLRSVAQWKPQDSQAERQAALSKWSQLLRTVPHFFPEQTQLEIVHEHSQVELGNLGIALCQEEHQHSSQPRQQSSAVRCLEGEVFSS